MFLRGKKSHALRNLNFNDESPQMGHTQIDHDFVFYLLNNLFIFFIVHISPFFDYIQF